VDGQFQLVIKTSTSHIVANYCGSYALGSSVLECRVYAKHKIGSDDFIGGMKDVIELLLAERAAGSLYILMLSPFH
jgi:hypothetical protein